MTRAQTSGRMAGTCDRTETLKHLVNGAFVGVHHDALFIQHQDVHGQPLGGHPQRVVYTDKDRPHFNRNLLICVSGSFNTDHQESRVWEASQQSSRPSWTSQSNENKEKRKQLGQSFFYASVQDFPIGPADRGGQGLTAPAQGQWCWRWHRCAWGWGPWTRLCGRCSPAPGDGASIQSPWSL